jgi:hypothetical protein
MLTKLNNSIILEISNNLEDSELLEIAASNIILKNDIKKLLEERKAKYLNKLFNYFTFDGMITIRHQYYFTFDKITTIPQQYDKLYEKYRNKLLYYIPELFDFIKTNNITKLDFSCTTSYGGHPDCLLNNIMKFSEEQIIHFMDQLYQLIESNSSHTLTYCNLGGFENHIDKDKLIKSIELHPSIQVISIRSNGSCVYYKKPPTNLYKRNGIIEWSHF